MNGRNAVSLQELGYTHHQDEIDPAVGESADKKLRTALSFSSVESATVLDNTFAMARWQSDSQEIDVESLHVVESVAHCMKSLGLEDSPDSHTKPAQFKPHVPTHQSSQNLSSNLPAEVSPLLHRRLSRDILPSLDEAGEMFRSEYHSFNDHTDSQEISPTELQFQSQSVSVSQTVSRRSSREFVFPVIELPARERERGGSVHSEPPPRRSMTRDTSSEPSSKHSSREMFGTPLESPRDKDRANSGTFDGMQRLVSSSGSRDPVLSSGSIARQLARDSLLSGTNRENLITREHSFTRDQLFALESPRERVQSYEGLPPLPTREVESSKQYSKEKDLEPQSPNESPWQQSRETPMHSRRNSRDVLPSLESESYDTQQSMRPDLQRAVGINGSLRRQDATAFQGPTRRISRELSPMGASSFSSQERLSIVPPDDQDVPQQQTNSRSPFSKQIQHMQQQAGSSGQDHSPSQFMYKRHSGDLAPLVYGASESGPLGSLPLSRPQSRPCSPATTPCGPSDGPNSMSSVVQGGWGSSSTSPVHNNNNNNRHSLGVAGQNG
eukprot:gene30704-37959_t